MRFAPFFTQTRSLTLPAPTTSVEDITAVARMLLDRFEPGRPVRLLGVRAEFDRARRTPGSADDDHRGGGAVAVRFDRGVGLVEPAASGRGPSDENFATGDDGRLAKALKPTCDVRPGAEHTSAGGPGFGGPGRCNTPGPLGEFGVRAMIPSCRNRRPTGRPRSGNWPARGPSVGSSVRSGRRSAPPTQEVGRAEHRGTGVGGTDELAPPGRSSGDCTCSHDPLTDQCQGSLGRL